MVDLPSAIPERRASEPLRTETLYAVIGAIAEGPDLDRVLPAIVDLLVDATACHACFIYLREGDKLQIRAASPVFAEAIGKVTLRMDEGLTGWVARHRRPAFIREDALNDPRIKYVAELQEEHFQSMVAVPLLDRHGDVIGVVVLHTQAPREFSEATLELLVHVASLVVGAIDNARLYDSTRRQLGALRSLSELSAEIASRTTREGLYSAGADGIARLLSADSCTLALYDEHGAAITVASSPAATLGADSATGGGDSPGDAAPNPAGQLVHAAGGGRLTAHLLDGGRAFGRVRVARALPFNRDDERLLETAANQLSMALRTAELIEHLAAENLVGQVFEALEHGNVEVAAARARAAGWDPATRHVAAVARPLLGSRNGWDESLSNRLDRQLRIVAAGPLIDIQEHGLRALVPLSGADERDDQALMSLRDRLASVAAELGVGVGISGPRPMLSEDLTILKEAEDAARIGAALHREPSAWTFSELGAYRFLVDLIGSPPPDPEHARALMLLDEYDRRRNAPLLNTLEAYLAARGAMRVAAATLVIHPNTLRQRIERIEELTGITVAEQDLLSLELSLKVFRLSDST